MPHNVILNRPLMSRYFTFMFSRYILVSQASPFYEKIEKGLACETRYIQNSLVSRVPPSATETWGLVNMDTFLGPGTQGI